MPTQRMCKSCGRSVIVWNTAQTRCAKCQKARSKAKAPKPIKKVGKQTLTYNRWRDTVAKPYLNDKFGYRCAVRGCHVEEDLHVDHVRTRGSRHDLKMVVTNVRYLCFEHHRLITDGHTFEMRDKERS